jgi:hypothetical protein
VCFRLSPSFPKSAVTIRHANPTEQLDIIAIIGSQRANYTLRLTFSDRLKQAITWCAWYGRTGVLPVGTDHATGSGRVRRVPIEACRSHASPEYPGAGPLIAAGDVNQKNLAASKKVVFGAC